MQRGWQDTAGLDAAQIPHSWDCMLPQVSKLCADSSGMKPEAWDPSFFIFEVAIPILNSFSQFLQELCISHYNIHITLFPDNTDFIISPDLNKTKTLSLILAKFVKHLHLNGCESLEVI